MKKNKLFVDLLQSLITPSLETLKLSLQARQNVNVMESDVITYLVCFARSLESQVLLSEFSLKFTSDNRYLYDSANNSIHLKIFIDDLSHEILSLQPKWLVKAFSGFHCVNEVAGQMLNGTYIPDFVQAISGMNKDEFVSFSQRYLPGLKEDVITFSLPLFQINPSRVIVHLTRIPARNTAENLQRLFSGVNSVIVATNSDFPEEFFSLSAFYLQQRTELYESFRKPFWYVINTPEAASTITFLNKINVDSVLIDHQGALADYISQVLEKIRNEIVTLKLI